MPPHISSLSPWRFCTAPMMEWSDRHCRYFWRLMTQKARLYTEMVTSGALLHGDRKRFLNFNHEEHPLALQLGGNNPQELAICAQIAEEYGYDEVNLNCGCPSDRVQEGRIGACLMAEPELVAECLHTMQSRVSIPVTVKHRLGIDDRDSQEELCHFIQTIKQSGCKTFIVHARKAWLNGLSPKENREIPPLEYKRVIDIKQQFPDATIVVNGGIKDLSEARRLLDHVDGVMMGREAYQNPFALSQVDHLLFEHHAPELTRQSIIEAYMDYCAIQIRQGARLHHMTRHILGLFSAQPGGRLFRQHISLHAHKPGAGLEVLRDALSIQRQAEAQYLQHHSREESSQSPQTCIHSELRG